MRPWRTPRSDASGASFPSREEDWVVYRDPSMSSGSPPHRSARPAEALHGRSLALLRGPLLLREALHLLEVAGLFPAQMARQRGNRREAKEVDDRDLAAEGLFQLLVCPHDEERV